jgi:hypothetical protein
MHVHSKIAIVGASLALGAAPALALAAGPSSHPTGRPAAVTTGVPSTVTTGAPSTTPSGPPSSTPPSNQGTAHKPTTPGPGASLPTKARAYGAYCQGESKQHVAGQPGTPFATCVTDMAKLANGRAKNPTAACQGESKRHVAGQRGTPFSLCVSGAAKLLRSEGSSGQSTSAS